MDIESITSLKAFKQLGPAWDQLWSASPGADILFSYEWFKNWLDLFAAKPRLLVLVARENQQTRAILPLMRCWERTHGIAIRVVRSVTNCHSHGFDLVALEADPVLFSEMIKKAFRAAHKSLIILDHVSERSLLHRLITGDGHFPYLSHFRLHSENCQIRLEGSFDEYFNQRSSRFRKNVRAAERKALERGPLQLVHVNRLEELKQITKNCYDLEITGWKGRDKEALLQVRQAHDFYFRLAQKWCDEKRLDVFILKSNDEWMAFYYCINSAGAYRAVRIGINEAFRNLGPGMLLTKYTLEKLFAEQSGKVWDFCGGSARWKSDWCNGREKFYRVFIFRDNWLGRVLYHCARRLEHFDMLHSPGCPYEIPATSHAPLPSISGGKHG
ncbi:MAG TPA: GNAT family N-acetyltransferase [bacterium]|nr:GNAT family N-acetyltransferase [bacterium]